MSHIYPRAWVKLGRYCEISGEAADAVHARRRTGKWRQGYHWIIRDGRVWIHLERADEWVEHGETGGASRFGRMQAAKRPTG